MKPQEGSPNWHWQRLGYSIERVQNKRMSDGSIQRKRRIITRPDGTVVDTGDGSHEDEIEAAMNEYCRERQLALL